MNWIKSYKAMRLALSVWMISVVVMAWATPATAVRMLNDNTIVNAVEDEILFDPAVPSYHIRVTCEHGIITLTGTVDSLLAKNRAVDIAETVKGVRAVINEIKVSSLTNYSDQKIGDNIRLALVENPATDSAEIRVDVSNGVTTLKGNVDSYLEKDLARIVASGVSGVTRVINHLAFTIDRTRPDRELLADIRQGMRWDALLDHGMIAVQVKDGKVTLSGVVGSAAEKRRAMNKAWLPGTREVIADGLKVEGWARNPALREHKYEQVSDAAVRDAVARAVVQDPRVDARDVDVEVYDGVVVLKGDVGNLQARRSAAQDARNTVGVFMVKNHLKVRRPDTNPGDTEVADKINQALKRDAYLDSYEISATVRHGVARLYGKVQTRFEKARAEDVVSVVPGVFAVDNNILSRRVWRPFVYNPYVDDKAYPDHYTWYRAMETAAPGKSDREILDSIKDELWWSPFVDADQVKVAVENGRATLEGEVDSRMEVNAAVENALEGGAVSVDNELSISGQSGPGKG
jgi:osmotically-inducible protein OsmY